MALEYVDEFAAAGDGTTSLVISTPGSKSRATVEGLISVVAENIITSDPTIKDAAAAAVTTAAAEGRFVKAVDAPSAAGDDGAVYLGSQSGYALIGWKSNGDLSTWTRAFFKEQVSDIVEAAKIPGVYRLELTPSGYATRIIYDNGTQELPGLIGGGGSGGGSAVIPDTVNGVTYLTDITTGIRSRLVPTDRTRLVINGTSTFAGMASQFTAFGGARGATLVNTATAGVGAEQTLAKLGSRPFVTSGSTTIAGTGSTSLASSNVPASIFNAWSVSGAFEGFSNVHGTISKPGGGGAASWAFTRDTDGASFTVPAGTKFIPDANANRDAIILLNVGKNNLSGGVDGVTTDVAQIIQWTKDAYAWATSTGKSVLVVGHYQDTGTPADSAARTRIKAYNDAMRSTFGARFVDMGAYVASTQIFTDLGLTPDSADLAEITLGNKAPQISAYSAGAWPSGTVDPLHLSIPARGAVVDNLIGRALTVTLNWMLEASS
ncbi:hypothetical protein [Microbacterium sp. Leaf436]|uniref:hypothetical protein n=1 Tax=Microbacterium sp. Leaf436 TaxID=1736377 RepID=UPI0006FEDB8E|nr:hypothetical protein [Microbacterium sp. Leaf436]KQT75417.1 hypothetical protein ASG45_02640 [Microbacterium sp. Leaf436]